MEHAKGYRTRRAMVERARDLTRYIAEHKFDKTLDELKPQFEELGELLSELQDNPDVQA